MSEDATSSQRTAVAQCKGLVCQPFQPLRPAGGHDPREAQSVSSTRLTILTSRYAVEATKRNTAMMATRMRMMSISGRGTKRFVDERVAFRYRTVRTQGPTDTLLCLAIREGLAIAPMQYYGSEDTLSRQQWS